jgi:hypothetical protein
MYDGKEEKTNSRMCECCGPPQSRVMSGVSALNIHVVNSAVFNFVHRALLQTRAIYLKHSHCCRLDLCGYYYPTSQPMGKEREGIEVDLSVFCSWLGVAAQQHPLKLFVLCRHNEWIFHSAEGDSLLRSVTR